MFEVGKKYKSNAVNGLVVEVLCVTNKNAFSRIVEHWHPGYIGVETTYGQDKFYLWEEYKEPRTITRWVNVYEVDGELTMGSAWYSKEEAIAKNQGNSTYKDTITITYTEPH